MIITVEMQTAFDITKFNIIYLTVLNKIFRYIVFLHIDQAYHKTQLKRALQLSAGHHC